MLVLVSAPNISKSFSEASPCGPLFCAYALVLTHEERAGGPAKPGQSGGEGERGCLERVEPLPMS